MKKRTRYTAEFKTEIVLKVLREEDAVNAMLMAQHVEETAYRSCMGVLQMEKKYGRERLEAACTKARSIGSMTYSVVKNILRNIQDKPMAHTKKPLPQHSNLRDPAPFV